MLNPKEMTLSEVIAVIGCHIGEELERQGHDIDYPDRSTAAILAVVDRCDKFAAGGDIIGFGIAARYLVDLVKAIGVQLPEELNDRLHGRIG